MAHPRSAVLGERVGEHDDAAMCRRSGAPRRARRAGRTAADARRSVGL